jgi:quercetin dioxygenase-like cupin family protein
MMEGKTMNKVFKVPGGPFFLLAATLLFADTPRLPKVEDIASILHLVKLQPGAVPVRTFVQGENLTVNVVTPSSPIPAHYHAKHEEVVYVVKGSGTMELAGETRDVKEGDLVYIHRKAAHSFRPKGKEVRVLSIFAPAFDGKDRIFIKEKVR